MLKAIIADDEKWICQMIGEMIDWEELDIELIGQAADGLEAYRLICSQKPDIVITDIRMPGMDGIELIKKAREMNLLTRFIIISGFQHFEYAKNAIKFGVDDYLLKPIKKVELTNILEKIRQDYQEIETKKMEDTQIKKKYRENIIKLRRQFLSDLILEKIDTDYDLYKINAEYQFSFYEGCFQIINVKLDRKNQAVHEMENDYREVCYRKYLDILINTLQDYCYDIQRFDDNMYLLNFSIGNQQVIDKKIKETFNEFRNYLISLNYFDVTLGLGSTVSNLGKISESADAAKRGIMCRIKYGVNQIIDYSKLEFNNFDEYNLSRMEKIKLRNIIETLDVDNLRQFIIDKFNSNSIAGDVNPCIYFNIAHQIADVFIETMSSIVVAGNVRPDINNDVNNFQDCKSIEDLTDTLIKNLSTEMQNYRKIIDEYEMAPIRLAKQFVSENYQNKITLDDVAEIVSMSPGYFSSYFKNKAGINFHEYVINYRMDIAKDLLLDIHSNVNEISQKVGYKSTKHFSKLFKEKVGVNPSDYRKIHL